MITVLIDTNVLLDVLQRRAPHYIAAERIWQQTESGAVVGYVAAISINNVYYIARKQAGHAKAMELIGQIRKTFRIADLTAAVLDRAISMQWADLEDGIQAAAAFSVEADYLITRDSRGFANSPVKAVSPDDFLAITSQQAC